MADGGKDSTSTELPATALYRRSDRWLIDQLEEGRKHFDAGDKHAAVLIDLIAVVDWLNRKAAIQEAGLTEPLVNLAVAFADVANGKKHPLLTPATPAHSPNSPSRDRMKAVSALALDILIERGMTRDNAAKLVERELERIGRKPAKVTRATILQWRSEMRNRASEMALEQYRQFSEARKAFDGKWARPEDEVRHLFENLGKLL